MTPLSKRVTRKSSALVRDGGRSRQLVVTMYPGDLLGLRPERTRREELIPLTAIYSLAVKMRVAQQRADRKAKRGAR